MDTNSTGIRVETCPISGTVARDQNCNRRWCADVDLIDKFRICLPGTVCVIDRRQIEMYSRLTHTVDHVEGYLCPEFDALDDFLCHTWATVTGAPKMWAI